MQVDAPKAADHNGCLQIIHLNRKMGVGLKILCPLSLQGCYLDRVLQTAGRLNPILPGNAPVHSHRILMRGDHWNQGPEAHRKMRTDIAHSWSKLKSRLTPVGGECS